MSRRTLIVAGVITAALVIAIPVVALLLLGPSATRTGESAPPMAGPPRADRVFWSFAAPSFGEGELAFTYSLQAGTLVDDQPIVSLEVRYVVNGADFARFPAVSAPVAGTVVFAGDSGATSSIQAIAIEPNAVAEPIVELDDIVWDLAVSPRGDVAYAALQSRNGVDHGVVAIALDGSGQVEQLTGPFAATQRHDVVFAALVEFDVNLRISADGSYLLRTSCTNGRCGVDVIDVETGAARTLDEPRVIDAVDGVAYTDRCPQAGPCQLVAIDLASGEGRLVGNVERPGMLTIVDAAPIAVAEQWSERDERVGAVRAVNVESGASSLLVEARADEMLRLRPPGIVPDLQLAMPDGWVVVEVSRAGRQSAVIIDVATGDRVEATLPPLAPPPNGING